MPFSARVACLVAFATAEYVSRMYGQEIPAKMKSGITFKDIDGDADGSKEILARRKAGVSPP